VDRELDTAFCDSSGSMEVIIFLFYGQICLSDVITFYYSAISASAITHNIFEKAILMSI